MSAEIIRMPGTRPTPEELLRRALDAGYDDVIIIGAKDGEDYFEVSTNLGQAELYLLVNQAADTILHLNEAQ